MTRGTPTAMADGTHANSAVDPSMTPIPFFDLKRQWPLVRDDIEEAQAAIFESQEWILGEAVGAFERAFSETVGARHTIGVTSGTDALILILRALERRSPATAGAAMTAHIHNVADLLADHLAEQGVLSETGTEADGRMRRHLAGLPGRADPEPGGPGGNASHPG